MLARKDKTLYVMNEGELELIINEISRNDFGEVIGSDASCKRRDRVEVLGCCIMWFA